MIEEIPLWSKIVIASIAAIANGFPVFMFLWSVWTWTEDNK